MNFFRYLAKHTVTAFLSLLMTILLAAGCLYFYIVVSLPDVNALKDYRLQVPLRIYSADGQLIGEYGAMRRNPVTLDQVPELLLQAMIATEDQRFFEHSGVDFIGILRAARELLITGQRNQGASTITMQVARNFFLTPEKTFTRKINEILLALKINSTFSKEKILELYVNKIYFGQRAYGVSAAAEIYYGKKLSDLNLAEMAMIAGLPQAPSKENPIINPRAAKQRRDHVLQRMLEMNYIDQKAYEEAIKAPAKAYYHGAEITLYAPHVAEMVRNVIYEQFGEAGYTSGIEVYTTLNAKLQAAANDALREGLIAYERRHGGFRKPERYLGHPPQDTSAWQDILANIPIENGLQPAVVMKTEAKGMRVLLTNGLTILVPWNGGRQSLKPGDVVRVSLQDNGQWTRGQIPKIEGAVVLIDADTGAILALNGGIKGAESGFNRVTQSVRQPGSAFKPFIYAAALARGYHLATMIDDSPIAINDTGDPNRLWRPKNDDNQFLGPTRMRIGLVRSVNIVTIRLLQMIGLPFALDYLSKFGFDPATLPHGLSLALGTPSVTPLQMANAYAVFANGGYRITPYFIQTIKAEDGKKLYEANPAVAPQDASEMIPNAAPRSFTAQTQLAPKVIDTEIAYLITHVLQDVIRRGTGRAASVLNRSDVAGKTGTHQQYDAWFVGYNRRVVAAVWVGFDKQKPIYEHGSQAALPIWVDLMRVALAGTPEQSLYPPSDIVSIRIDPYTGFLADPYQEDAIFEVFRTGSTPQEAPATNEDLVETEESMTESPGSSW